MKRRLKIAECLLLLLLISASAFAQDGLLLLRSGQVANATNFWSTNALYYLEQLMARGVLTNAQPGSQALTDFAQLSTNQIAYTNNPGTITIGTVVQTNARVGPLPVWTTTTNIVAVYGGGNAVDNVTYVWNSIAGVYTNTQSGGRVIYQNPTWYINRAGVNHYSASSPTGPWAVVSGSEPAPSSSWGYYYDLQGAVLRGPVNSTNLARLDLINTFTGASNYHTGALRVGGKLFVDLDVVFGGSLTLGGITASGPISTTDVFEGSGYGLTDLDAEALAQGYVPIARLATNSESATDGQALILTGGKLKFDTVASGSGETGLVQLRKPNGVVTNFVGTTDSSRGQALTNANAQATAGDTIEVGPGTYLTTAPIGKTGVNWYFAPGATVTNATTHIWSDATAAIVCEIKGFGNFDSFGGDVLNLTNASSRVVISANRITATNDTAVPFNLARGATVIFDVQDYISSGYDVFLGETAGGVGHYYGRAPRIIAYDNVFETSGTLQVTADEILSLSADVFNGGVLTGRVSASVIESLTSVVVRDVMGTGLHLTAREIRGASSDGVITIESPTGLIVEDATIIGMDSDTPGVYVDGQDGLVLKNVRILSGDSATYSINDAASEATVTVVGTLQVNKPVRETTDIQGGGVVFDTSTGGGRLHGDLTLEDGLFTSLIVTNFTVATNVMHGTEIDMSVDYAATNMTANIVFSGLVNVSGGVLDVAVRDFLNTSGGDLTVTIADSIRTTDGMRVYTITNNTAGSITFHWTSIMTNAGFQPLW